MLRIREKYQNTCASNSQHMGAQILVLSMKEGRRKTMHSDLHLLLANYYLRKDMK